MTLLGVIMVTVEKRTKLKLDHFKKPQYVIKRQVLLRVFYEEIKLQELKMILYIYVYNNSR